MYIGTRDEEEKKEKRKRKQRAWYQYPVNKYDQLYERSEGEQRSKGTMMRTW